MTRESKHWGCKLVSFFLDLPIEKADSETSGKLQVRYVNGRLVLDSPHANYSYGSLHRLFRKIFRSRDIGASPPKNMLLLGLGGGSVVSILRDEYKLDLPITAVEIDPEVIRIAREHFGLDRYSYLEVICMDAAEYMKTAEGRFGMIIADLFIDNSVPRPFTGLPFLADCRSKLAADGILIFNFILSTGTQNDQYKELLKNLDTAGFRYAEKKVFATNRVLIVRHAGNPG